MGWFLGKAIPFPSRFLKSLLGMSSTMKLHYQINTQSLYFGFLTKTNIKLWLVIRHQLT